MVCSLRRGVGVAVVRVPAVLGFVADGLAIALAAFAFLLPTADSVANEMSDNVVLDFTATWCGPCRQMSPIVRKLEQQGYAIRAVDVDREPQLAQRFNIQTIPCFVLVMNGKEVRESSGQSTRTGCRPCLPSP